MTIVLPAILTGALVASPLASAEVVLGMGGTTNPTPSVGQIQRRLDGRYANYSIVPVTTPEQFAPFFGTLPIAVSERQGQKALDAAIKAQYAADPTQKIIVSGYSQSAAVQELEKAALLNDPDAPPAGMVVFEETGNISRGSGAPTQGTSPRDYVDSQYDTIDVVYQYDPSGAAPPITGWLNPLTTLNAGASSLYDHLGTPAALVLLAPQSGYENVDLSTVPAENIVVKTNTNRSTTTYYNVPEPDLPLLNPLRDAGVKPTVVNKLNTVLKPLVDAGYQTPSLKSTVTTVKAETAAVKSVATHKAPVKHPIQDAVTKIVAKVTKRTAPTVD